MRARLFATLVVLFAAWPVQATSLAYVPNAQHGLLSVIDARTASVVERRPFVAGHAASLQGLVYGSSGSELYLVDGIGNINGSVSLQPQHAGLGNIDAAQPSNVSLAPDARHLALCAYDQREVLFIDTARLMEAWSIRMRGGKPGQCGYSPDGRWLLVLHPEQGDIEVLDVVRRTSAASIRLESAAQGFGFAADGRALYIATATPNHYVMLDVGSWRVRRSVVAEPFRRPQVTRR